MSLALNMIVGAGDGAHLDRALKSIDAKNTFDEIVLVPTTNDSDVVDVCNKWTDKVFHQQWACEEFPYGNFSRARNVALDNTNSDYVMWLDSDDVIRDESKAKLAHIKKVVNDPKNDRIDVYYVRYDVVHDEGNLKPTVSFMRERIFRRDIGFRWKDAVHEQFLPSCGGFKTAEFAGFSITHMSDKPCMVSALRNIKIIEHEIKKCRDYEAKTGREKRISSHLLYFLGRDMLMVGKAEEGIKILDEMVDRFDSSPENLAACANDIMFYYAYNGIKTRPEINEWYEKNERKIESWCRLSTAMSNGFAEPLVILGDIYMKRGLTEKAEACYLEAMQRKYGRSGMQTITFYLELPAQRVTAISKVSGNLERALYYNGKALACNKSQKNVAHRKTILEELVTEFSDKYCVAT